MPKKKNRIRPLALCVFHRGDSIFAARGYDSLKQQTFYRSIGGGIEFGERAVDTVRREILEELNAEVTDLHYIGTLENIFTYEGETGHEIVMLFDGRFVEDYRNQDDYRAQGSDDNETLYTAEWLSLDYFRQGNAPLYPEGLLALLDGKQA
jgi:8-oxo-dGTP pyrophosphatase MutT (NUDIX family)